MTDDLLKVVPFDGEFYGRIEPKQLLKTWYEGSKGIKDCLLYTSPSPRDATLSRMPSSA